jgi:aryl-alcohol dehydrogenase-like predicted oxidoreductase
MNQMHRRHFLTATAGTAACLGSTAWAEQPDTAPPPPPTVPIGKTGITTTRLAMGTGVHGGNRQSDQTRMGFDKLVTLFRHAYDRGLRFFDLADLYGTHVYFREALRKMPRDQVTILTKLWWRYDGPSEPVAESYRKKVAAATLERFCHELSTDYLDVVLLHCMTTPKWDRELAPYMEALTEAKEKKRVRAVGVSCHDLGALEEAARCPWVDVVLARINPAGVMCDGKPEEVLKAIRHIKASGKAVVGMKIFGEGKLADRKDECIRFAQGLGLLDAMTIGFQTPEQIDQVLALLAKHPAAKVETP